MFALRSEVPEDVGNYLKRLEAAFKDLSYLERGGFGSEQQDMQRAGRRLPCEPVAPENMTQVMARMMKIW